MKHKSSNRKKMIIGIVCIVIIFACIPITTAVDISLLKTKEINSDIFIRIHKGDKQPNVFLGKIQGCYMQVYNFGDLIPADIYFNVTTYELSGNYLGSTEYSWSLEIGNNSGAYCHINPQTYVYKITFVKATAKVNDVTSSKYGLNIGPFILILI